jgi:AcrR family transcriptional regulator
MTTEAKNERRALTREIVVEAALASADAGGLEAVSFRRLAADLSVTPMALYRYVSGKEELLAAVVERVFAEFEMPADGEADWRDHLRDLARAFRRLLVAHPAAAELYFAAIETESMSGLRIVEVLLGVLQRAGFSSSEAALLEGNLERNVLALVLLETRAAAAGTPEEQAARVRAQRARLLMLPPDEFPHVVEAADQLCGAIDPDEAFEFALDLLIGGLEKLMETSPRHDAH